MLFISLIIKQKKNVKKGSPFTSIKTVYFKSLYIIHFYLAPKKEKKKRKDKVDNFVRNFARTTEEL